MKSMPFRRALPFVLALVLAGGLYTPADAFFFSREDPDATVAAFSKNGMTDSVITFSQEDFYVQTDGKATLNGIIVTSLPASAAGTLQVGNELVTPGSTIASSALGGLRFYPASQPQAETSFTFLPVFATHTGTEEVAVSLHLLAQENSAPVAEDLTLSTYKNVAVTGRLAAVDPEGDLLTFQLMDKAARGSVTLSEEGDGTFLYTPYENKTGKDSFTYVAVDAAGNTSEPATVSIRIEKADTKVSYADMSGHPAHKAAIRLAEEGVLIGACMNGSYYFAPDTPVTRSEFLAMAMQVAQAEPLEEAAATGFWDDESIAAWAKPYVASALKSGLIQGHANDLGQVVFSPNEVITAAEASVLLDRLLNITDVSAETFGVAAAPDWAVQSAANLSSCGMLDQTSSLEEELDRGSAAQLLCAALEVLDARQDGGLFSW